MLDMSIPTTSSAPAFEANIERIPVPHPTCLISFGSILDGRRTHIKDSFALEQVGVLHDGISVTERSDGVFQHLFVDTYMSVWVGTNMTGRTEVSVTVRTRQ